MRARLGIKLFGLVVTLVLTMFGLRSLLGGGAGPTPALTSIVRHGAAAVCADVGSVADPNTGATPSPSDLTSGGVPAADLSKLAKIGGLPSSALVCPTTTTTTSTFP